LRIYKNYVILHVECVFVGLIIKECRSETKFIANTDDILPVTSVPMMDAAGDFETLARIHLLTRSHVLEHCYLTFVVPPR
jgi:hypothetical protein